MRLKLLIGIVAAAVLAGLFVVHAQSTQRLNPMIALYEKGLPVFGVTHPAIVAGGRGFRGGAPAENTTPPPQPVLADAARDTLAYKLSDFEYNSYSPANAARFKEYMEALIAAGAAMSAHPFIAKIPIVPTDPAVATARNSEQRDAGHAGSLVQEVETADEVRQAISAMRFKSKGGTRPDGGIALAAKYWKLSEAQYREKADLWPLNKNGELIIWAIIESKKGIANVREIAAVPGVTVLTVGAGTLGGVFSSTNAAGERVRDQDRKSVV